jgi:hypothetical protein
LTGTRDYQRSKVYAWENRVIAPCAPGVVSFAEAQGMVGAIWAEMGLKYPPAVEPLPRQASKTVASATRLSIFLSGRTPAWCVLHEIAHAMTSTVEEHSDGHGRLFMGLYLQLIVRYLRVDKSALMRSLDEEGIKVALQAQPVFASI